MAFVAILFHLSPQRDSGLPLLSPSSVSPYLRWNIKNKYTRTETRFLENRFPIQTNKHEQKGFLSHLIKIGRRFEAPLCPPRKHHNLALPNSATQLHNACEKKRIL